MANKNLVDGMREDRRKEAKDIRIYNRVDE